MRSIYISVFTGVISWSAGAQEINSLDSITKKTIDNTYNSLLEKQKVVGLRRVTKMDTRILTPIWDTVCQAR